MTDSADRDQLASSDIHSLLRQGMSCSAREGLKGPTLKGKILLSLGVNSSLLEYTFFRRVLVFSKTS